MSVCMYVSVNLKNYLSINLKLENIVVYYVRHWALSDQGQGRNVASRFFSIILPKYQMSSPIFQPWHMLRSCG